MSLEDDDILFLLEICGFNQQNMTHVKSCIVEIIGLNSHDSSYILFLMGGRGVIKDIIIDESKLRC